MTSRISPCALSIALTGVILCALSQPLYCADDDLAIKNGQKIAFLGDSITSQGAASPSGYVRLVISGLAANGIKAEAIPAGVSGNTSKDMLNRLEKSVLSQKPDWMTLSCGVNDVWHGPTGVELEPYKVNISSIVDRAQAAGIKVMILTATMIREDQGNDLNKKLVSYNEFLRKLASEKHCLLADLNSEMQAAVAKAMKDDTTTPHVARNYLTVDGVHMKLEGNLMMATGILKGFGFDQAKISQAREYWMDVPGLVDFSLKKPSTLRQYKQLSRYAANQKRSVEDLINAEFTKSLDALLKQAAAAGEEK